MGETSNTLLEQLQSTHQQVNLIQEQCETLLVTTQQVDLMEMYQQHKTKKASSIMGNLSHDSLRNSTQAYNQQEEMKVIHGLEAKLSQHIATQMTSISDIIAEIEQTNSTLQQCAIEVTESIEKMNSISEVGVEEYISQYYAS